MDRITDFLSDLPIGLIIFLIAIVFGMFGKDDKKRADTPAPRREMAPEQTTRPSIFASDDRRAREERAMRAEQERGEVITFGGLEFGSSDALFRQEQGERDARWGQTKYGFDESEWGSAFPDRKSSDPIIR